MYSWVSHTCVLTTRIWSIGFGLQMFSRTVTVRRAAQTARRYYPVGKRRAGASVGQLSGPQRTHAPARQAWNSPRLYCRGPAAIVRLRRNSEAAPFGGLGHSFGPQHAQLSPMAHCVNSRQRSTLVAVGAKRTLTEPCLQKAVSRPRLLGGCAGCSGSRPALPRRPNAASFLRPARRSNHHHGRS
jgi:hypothetical protein